MNIKSKIIIIQILTFIFLFGVAANAQTEQIVGGYANAPVSGKDVIAAAKFAVTKRSRTQKTSINLISIKNAQRQVVAGMNYEICMQVSIRGKSKKTIRQSVQVVVYRSLKNVYSLTSWTKKNCSE